MLWLNLTRLLAIVMVYMYHDWESLVFLTWVLHSLIPMQGSRHMRLATVFLYLPL